MDLTTLVWPQPSSVRREEATSGDVLQPLYIKAPIAQAAEGEAVRIEKIEAPLKPEQEKEQRHQDKPVQQTVAEKLEEKGEGQEKLEKEVTKRQAQKPRIAPPVGKRSKVLF